MDVKTAACSGTARANSIAETSGSVKEASKATAKTSDQTIRAKVKRQPDQQQWDRAYYGPFSGVSEEANLARKIDTLVLNRKTSDRAKKRYALRPATLGLFAVPFANFHLSSMARARQITRDGFRIRKCREDAHFEIEGVVRTSMRLSGICRSVETSEWCACQPLNCHCTYYEKNTFQIKALTI